MKAMAPRPKRVPMRTCVACREQQEKRRLTRLVYRPGEGLAVDQTGKQHGRGAYLCPKTACWEKALTGQLLDRALRATLTAADKAALAEHAPGRTPERV
jgi:predicted RNA-binding protein YlxR (DUF448 family)